MDNFDFVKMLTAGLDNMTTIAVKQYVGFTV